MVAPWRLSLLLLFGSEIKQLEVSYNNIGHHSAAALNTFALMILPYDAINTNYYKQKTTIDFETNNETSSETFSNS